MAANRATVSPGEDVVYSVIVANVGSGDFPGTNVPEDKGQFRYEAHTPFGTTFRSFEPPPCGGHPVAPDPERPSESCVFVPAPVPGTGETTHVPTESRISEIRSGRQLAFMYRVSVDPGVPSGTKLVNHAHLYVVSQEPKTTGPVIVTVD